jgi:hypothetical protein
MSEINRYQILAAKTKNDYPRFNVKPRRSSWLGPVFWLLAKITGRDYGTFTTTIFSTMYVGETWEKKSSDDRYRTLRHEKMHIRQFHSFPFGRWAWPVNHLITAICYLIVLPARWTMRARFEREGYTQSLLSKYELEGALSAMQMEKNARWIAETFGGSTYFFMWQRAAAYEWAMVTQRKINAGEITNDRDRVDELRAA